MQSFRSIARLEEAWHNGRMSKPLARGRRVSIAYLTPPDEAAFLAAAEGSVELHANWVSPPRTSQQFADLLTRLEEDSTHGFLATETATGVLVGLINLSNVVMGRFRSANVGYYAFADGAGRGLMSEALGLVVRFAFDELDLHRLEAGIQPENRASLALVRRVGFRYEGLSLNYLWVDEAWRDHQRWALTTEDLD